MEQKWPETDSLSDVWDFGEMLFRQLSRYMPPPIRRPRTLQDVAKGMIMVNKLAEQERRQHVASGALSDEEARMQRAKAQQLREQLRNPKLAATALPPERQAYYAHAFEQIRMMAALSRLVADDQASASTFFSATLSEQFQQREPDEPLNGRPRNPLYDMVYQMAEAGAPMKARLDWLMENIEDEALEGLSEAEKKQLLKDRIKSAIKHRKQAGRKVGRKVEPGGRKGRKA
jgi:hypothetical protein